MLSEPLSARQVPCGERRQGEGERKTGEPESRRTREPVNSDLNLEIRAERPDSRDLIHRFVHRFPVPRFPRLRAETKAPRASSYNDRSEPETVTTMRRSLSYATALVLLVTSLAHAQGATHPATHAPEGGAPLSLAGQARRVHFLGTAELYSLAVYAESGPVDISQLASSSTAKALRIEIIYNNDLRRRMPIDWRRELIPALEIAATVSLRGTFGPLQHGDVVLISTSRARAHPCESTRASPSQASITT